ncbi:hypothetical protein AAXE64_08180 [Priestia megaterium]
MKEILDQFTNILERLDSMEKGLDGLGAQLEKISAKVDNIENKFKTSNTDWNRLGREVDDFAKKYGVNKSLK